MKLWIWGEMRAKYVEHRRRQRQALKDGLLFTGLLFLHIALMVAYPLWFRTLIRALGNYWVGVSLGQWLTLWALQRWICRQRWWQLR